MIEINFFTDIIKYAISGLIVFSIAWYLIKPFVIQSFNYQKWELKKVSIEKTLPLRLQAYERLTLFIERINPSNLFVRLQSPGMTAAQLHQLVLAEVRTEFQHNASQQIYISDNSWMVVKKIKDETISLVSSALNNLGPDATAMDLSKVVLTHLADLEVDNPYEVAISLIKKEIHALF